MAVVLDVRGYEAEFRSDTTDGHRVVNAVFQQLPKLGVFRGSTISQVYQDMYAAVTPRRSESEPPTTH